MEQSGESQIFLEEQRDLLLAGGESFAAGQTDPGPFMGRGIWTAAKTGSTRTHGTVGKDG